MCQKSSHNIKYVTYRKSCQYKSIQNNTKSYETGLVLTEIRKLINFDPPNVTIHCLVLKNFSKQIKNYFPRFRTGWKRRKWGWSLGGLYKEPPRVIPINAWS